MPRFIYFRQPLLQFLCPKISRGWFRFVDVQPGFFLQLLLTHTWVKCTSIDSSRCVVSSGIRFKAIRAASKKLEQDQDRMNGEKSGWTTFTCSCIIFFIILIFFHFFIDDRPVIFVSKLKTWYLCLVWAPYNYNSMVQNIPQHLWPTLLSLFVTYDDDACMHLHS